MYKVNLHSSISEIDATRWDQLCDPGYPFLRHAFLQALEASGSVGPETGWQPLHLEVTDSQTSVLVMPLYLKRHSWGEYVFDQSWADAYERNGLVYYPKLLNAIPFTPATGPRYGSTLSAMETQQLIPELLEQVMRQVQASSWHCLFPPSPISASASTHARLGCQYHWFNRGYADFDDFLSRFTSRKRKSILRERRKVQEQGIVLNSLTGSAILPKHIEQFYRFYQATYHKRGRRGYLTLETFHQLLDQMAEQMLLVLAEDEHTPVAAALYFIGSNTLYGRYWGCLEHYDSLHFEACYYQGIEFCIKQGLERFDPGAQGEHKIQRGFEPVRTWSLHHMIHPGFHQAVGDFVAEEHELMERRIEELTTWLPFKHA
ncbi:GNAT family N-acetyltransferase [Marinobacterium marinum]|uniref:N-acetyltransferase n=1 Tax=Marinobacterium marinum TaxID=2756129 RepID=A0A7W1WXN5_9GAMM|nr:GNAT family N-acetyltransferase [Marinobacterium marinum]MBA4502024.1 N-acetyltransferase [Marinobacterium marinum]